MEQNSTHRHSSKTSISQVSRYGFTDVWCSIEVLKIVKRQSRAILNELLLGLVQCKCQSPYPIIGEADVGMSTSIIGPIGTLRIPAKFLQVAIILLQKISCRSLLDKQENKI